MDAGQKMNITAKVAELGHGIIDAPITLVTVGAQGTGKSTIMNRLCQFNIFPQRSKDDPANGALTRMQIIVDLQPQSGYYLVEATHGQWQDKFTNENRIETEKTIYSFLKDQQKKQPGFSFEPFYLKVRGPALPSLYLIDNPGIISDNKDLMDNLIKLTNQSVIGKNILVLFFLSAADDPSNSPAWQVIHEVKNKQNIMVVLTKPDVVTSGGKGVHETMTNGIKGIGPEQVYVVKSGDTMTDQVPNILPEIESEYYETANDYYKQLKQNGSNRMGYTNFALAVTDNFERLFDENVQSYIKKVSAIRISAIMAISSLPSFVDNDEYKTMKYHDCVDIIKSIMKSPLINLKEITNKLERTDAVMLIHAKIMEKFQMFETRICEKGLDKILYNKLFDLADKTFKYDFIEKNITVYKTLLSDIPSERKIELAFVAKLIHEKFIKPFGSHLHTNLLSQESTIIQYIREDPAISQKIKDHKNIVAKCDEILRLVKQ